MPSHPFPALRAAGCKVTLNSDDPPYFWTSLKREYDVAAEHFGMDEKALAGVTRTAIEAAFVDRKTQAPRFWRGSNGGRADADRDKTVVAAQRTVSCSAIAR